MKFQTLNSVAFSTSLLLIGCSSDSESTSENEYARLKVYNAISNSATLQTTVDDSILTYTNFANSSSIFNFDPETYELAINRMDTNGDYINIISTDISVAADFQYLTFFTGTLENPQILDFSFDYTSKDDLAVEDEDDVPQFEFFIANLLNASVNLTNVDFYIAQADTSFSEATLVSSLGTNSFSDKLVLPQDDYKIYVTETGSSNLIFETDSISLNYLDTFILVFRNHFGPSEFALDKLASSSFTSTSLNIDADATLQFYQSESSFDAVDVYLEIPTVSPAVDDLAPRVLSDKLEIANGTYIVNTVHDSVDSESLLKNLILELQEGTEKIAILYRDLSEKQQALIVDKQGRPLGFENSLTLVSLVKDDEKNIEFYFVPDGESLSSTEFKPGKVGFAEALKTTLVKQPYQIFATIEDDADGERLIYQSDFIEFDTSKNYLLILEQDESTSTGYSLGVFEE